MGYGVPTGRLSSKPTPEIVGREEIIMFKKLLFGTLLTIIVLGGVFVYLIYSTPTEYRVERSIVIDRASSDVYDYLKILKHQNNWGPWFEKDPSMQQEFRGTDGSVGFVSMWKSNNSDVGEGEQEIVGLEEGKRVDTQLRFNKPFQAVGNSSLLLEPIDPQKTKVVWTVNGSMPRPMNVVLRFIDMDSAMGKDFDSGLKSLKDILEK